VVENTSWFQVALAVQTLSRSVAVALQTAQELGVEGLEDCQATIEFIMVRC
jgi:hypothetical protein